MKRHSSASASIEWTLGSSSIGTGSSAVAAGKNPLSQSSVSLSRTLSKSSLLLLLWRRKRSTVSFGLLAVFLSTAAVTVVVRNLSLLSITTTTNNNNHNHPSALRSPPSNGRGAAAAAAAADSAATTNAATDRELDDKDREDDARIVWKILQSAGVSESTLQQHAAQLPLWSTIVQQYGEHPVLVAGRTLSHNSSSSSSSSSNSSSSSSSTTARNDDPRQTQQALQTSTCAAYRAAVPPERRVLGAAGMFSTGTNLLTQLLKRNCYIPERLALYGKDATKEQLGIRWQVPWGKHTPAHYKWKHAATEQAAAIGKNDVLPVVTVRNPWRWMQSMCKNPYAAKWPHHDSCPHLSLSPESASTATIPEWNPVSVKYGAATESYASLQHLWNDWYNGYMDASVTGNEASLTESVPQQQGYPWIMVRMEDLVFHTVETISSVCECAGGRLYPNGPFQYITESAKADSPGHDTSTGLTEAWIKYSQPMSPGAGFTASDYAAALLAMDQSLMRELHYQHPPSIPKHGG